MKRYAKQFFVISALPIFLLTAILMQSNRPVFSSGQSQEDSGAILEAESDANGAIDPIICSYFDHKLYPVAPRDELLLQLRERLLNETQTVGALIVGGLHHSHGSVGRSQRRTVLH